MGTHQHVAYFGHTRVPVRKAKTSNGGSRCSKKRGMYTVRSHATRCARMVRRIRLAGAGRSVVVVLTEPLDPRPRRRRGIQDMWG